MRLYYSKSNDIGKIIPVVMLVLASVVAPTPLLSCSPAPTTDALVPFANAVAVTVIILLIFL